MGKIYIIELEEKEHLYKTKMILGEPVMCSVFPEPYTEPDLEQVRKEAYDKGYEAGREYCPGQLSCMDATYQKGFRDGTKQCANCEEFKESAKAKAYQRGLADAWEACRKIGCYEIDGGYPVGYMLDLFDRDDLPKILSDYTAAEAIEKLKAYEHEKEEFHVGDEFENESGKRFVILKMNGTEIDRYIDEEGKTYCMTVKYKVMRKTGRHFPEIAAVLEKMRGETDGKA